MNEYVVEMSQDFLSVTVTKVDEVLARNWKLLKKGARVQWLPVMLCTTLEGANKAAKEAKNQTVFIRAARNQAAQPKPKGMQ